MSGQENEQEWESEGGALAPEETYENEHHVTYNDARPAAECECESPCIGCPNSDKEG